MSICHHLASVVCHPYVMVGSVLRELAWSSVVSMNKSGSISLSISLKWMWLDRNVFVMIMNHNGFNFLFHIAIGAVLNKIRSLPCSHLLIYYGVGDLRKPPLRDTLVWPYVMNIQSNLPMRSPLLSSHLLAVLRGHFFLFCNRKFILNLFKGSPVL